MAITRSIVSDVTRSITTGIAPANDAFSPYSLAGDEADVAAFDFAAQRALVLDTGTPANDHDGDCSILTVTRATGEGHFNEYGMFVWDATNDTLRFDHDPETVSTSTTEAVIGMSTKSFTTNGAYTFVADQTVQVTDTASSSNFIRGKVESYDSGTNKLVIVPEVIGGSGTKSAWTIVRCLGILVEPQQTNLLTYSEAFDNAAWTTTSLTVSADQTAAPDGNTTADLVTEADGSNSRYARQVISISNDSTSYTLSVFGKQSSNGKISIRAAVTGGTAQVGVITLDLATLALNEDYVGDLSDWGSQALPNGWYRLWATLANNSTGNTSFDARISSAGLSGAQTADTGAAYLWGAQLVNDTVPGSYIPTTSSTVTRNADTVDMTLTEFPWNGGTGALEINGSSATAEDDGTFLEIADIAATEDLTHVETLTWVPS